MFRQIAVNPITLTKLPTLNYFRLSYMHGVVDIQINNVILLILFDLSTNINITHIKLFLSKMGQKNNV